MGGWEIGASIAQSGKLGSGLSFFWQYHGMAYENQGKLNAENLAEMAGETGLDKKAIKACLVSGETSAQVKRTESEAKRLHLTGTPSIFMNGRKFLQSLPEIKRS
uniref:Thioredoxin n=1 Tax=Candidatus Kentrum sp. FW TaxID=2126338 RepID=A0A450ST24_9GAMM|nr:MAG: Thioredoxin [Candidatus Kentron sp. FW]